MNRSYNAVSNKETILTVIFKRLRSLFGKENIFLTYYNLPLISNYFLIQVKEKMQLKF
jgi:hypothetical protein